MFCKISLQLNNYGKTQTCFFFIPLGPKTKEPTKLMKNKICFGLKLSKGDQGTCINFSAHEKFSNSFYFNFLGTIW